MFWSLRRERERWAEVAEKSDLRTMDWHSSSVNPNLPPTFGKIVASAPHNCGRAHNAMSKANPWRLPGVRDPPSMQPRRAGWHRIGSPNESSAASALMESNPVIPGSMRTAPAPFSLANFAIWKIFSTGPQTVGA